MGILCQKGCNWACRAIQGQTRRSRFFTSTWSQLFWHLRNSCALSIHLNCSGYCSRQKPWNSSDWHKRCILKWSTHLARNHIHAPTARILNPWKPKPSVSSPKNFVWPKAVRQKVVSMACWNHDETGFFEVRSWPGCVLLMMCSSGFEGQSLTKCVCEIRPGVLCGLMTEPCAMQASGFQDVRGARQADRGSASAVIKLKQWRQPVEELVMYWDFQTLDAKWGPTSKCYWLTASRNTWAMRRSGWARTCSFSKLFTNLFNYTN